MYSLEVYSDGKNYNIIKKLTEVKNYDIFRYIALANLCVSVYKYMYINYMVKFKAMKVHLHVSK